MTTVTGASWRKVEETDFLSSTGWLKDEVAEEFPMFKEFITPFVNSRREVSIGGIFKLWREFRGSDTDHQLCLNDIKRLWTAMALLQSDDSPFAEMPAECILYDVTTKKLMDDIKLTNAVS